MEPMYLIPIVILGGVFLADMIARNRAGARIESLFTAKRYDELLDYLDRWYARNFLPRYNRLYVTFNAYEAAGDEKSARETLELLWASSPSEKQRHDLIVRSFDFYLNHGPAEKAREMLDKMDDTLTLKAARSHFGEIYRIEIEKSSAYIERMERDLEGADTPTSLRLLALIARQYDNRGDTERAAEYRERMYELVK